MLETNGLYKYTGVYVGALSIADNDAEKNIKTLQDVHKLTTLYLCVRVQHE
jgi:hypothetical protein